MAERAAVEMLLERVGAALPATDTDRLATAVGERLRMEPAGSTAPRWRRPVLVALAAAAVIALIVALLPPTRHAVADFLGIGAVRISSEPATGGPYTGLELGPAVTLDEARAAVDFDVEVPTAAGYEQPDAVHLRRGPPLTEVSLVYETRPGRVPSPVAPVSVLITELQAEPDYAYVKKLFGTGTQIEFVTVGGDQGFWISGPVHELVVVGADGADHTEQIRLAANTLVWAHDGVTFRLESALDRAAAIALAVSMT